VSTISIFPFKKIIIVNNLKFIIYNDMSPRCSFYLTLWHFVSMIICIIKNSLIKFYATKVKT
jgi:hypothetical protein